MLRPLHNGTKAVSYTFREVLGILDASMRGAFSLVYCYLCIVLVIMDGVILHNAMF
jgi:hypothetical protein